MQLHSITWLSVFLPPSVTYLLYQNKDAAAHGVKLVYVNTRENAVETLMEISGGKGYDDVLVFAPVPAVIEQGDAILPLTAA